MKKTVTIESLSKLWEEYEIACRSLFMPLNFALVADVAKLPHPQEDIILTAKLLIFIAEKTLEDQVAAEYIRVFLRFLPHFLCSPQDVIEMNNEWSKMLDGEFDPSEFANSRLSMFLINSKNERHEINEEIAFFLKRSKIIPADDHLALHKACILLNVELEHKSSNPPLGKAILKTLFPLMK